MIIMMLNETIERRVLVASQSPDERGIVVQLLESGYRFVLGSIGGGTYNEIIPFV